MLLYFTLVDSKRRAALSWCIWYYNTYVTGHNFAFIHADKKVPRITEKEC